MKTLKDLQNIFNTNTKANLEIDINPSRIWQYKLNLICYQSLWKELKNDKKI
jgi:hypothetical protein